MHGLRSRGSACGIASTTTAAAAAAAASHAGIVRCTRRIRASLDYLIMQPSDLDQVRTRIRTTDALLVTWYLPLRHLQEGLHRRYEAETFGEWLLPPGAPPPPPPLARVPTQPDAPSSRHARFPLTAPTTTRSSSNDTRDDHEEAQDSREGSADGLRVPLGLVTLIVGNNTPSSQSLLERVLDPAPHATLALRVAVVDRVHWQRTCWLAQSICRSLCWGRLPQRIYSIDLDYRNEVQIGCTTTTSDDADDDCRRVLSPPSCAFSEAAQCYTAPVCVRVPGLGFRLVVEDTAQTLLDTAAPPVEGFADKESALHRLALAREVVMRGLGGSVYRQTLWCTPCLPNVARVRACTFGTLFTRVFGCNPVGPPVAAWLLREVPQTLIYQIEAEVEDENDLNSATTFGDRSITERVQKKAMNRYHAFRDDVRAKLYSDLDGSEMPR